VIPIQDLLHRIWWDPAWRAGRFDIGYLDRVAGTLVRVPLHDLHLDGGAHPALTVHDPAGTAARIPLHRIRRVWRDGTVIWERRSAGALQWPHDGDPQD
jgi:uncharacterized protein (UPF0248 family)